LAGWLKREDLNKNVRKLLTRFWIWPNPPQSWAWEMPPWGRECRDCSYGCHECDGFWFDYRNDSCDHLGILITTGITKSILKVVRSLDDGSQQTSSAAQQVASASQQLSQGATEQASSLEETSSALDQMTSMIKQNADNAAKASQMATETKHQRRKW